ncbi:WD40 repeat domain-containing protein [Streptomyces sp. NPDC001966]
MTAFATAEELLASAASRADRTAAVLLAAEVAGPWFAGWLRRRCHLLVRGGVTALLREALGTPLLSGHARARLALPGAPQLRARPAATSRAALDARLWSYESGLQVAHAAFTAGGTNGSRVHIFGHGDSCDADPDSLQSNWFVGLSGGAPDTVHAIGQTRDGEGTFAVSPDGSLLAVRSHRSIALHALPTFAPRGTLAGFEGPRVLCFLDDRRLLSLDGSTLELWDVEARSKLASADSGGSSDMAVSPDGRYAVVGALGNLAHTVHELPSLRLLHTFESVPLRVATGPQPEGPAMTWLPRRDHTSAVAFAPSGRHLVTGDWGNNVHLWDLSALLDALDGSDCPIDPSTGRYTRTGIPATPLGRHARWVSAARFVDDRTVVTGGWDGAVLVWDTARPGHPQQLGGHAGYVTAIDVSPDGRTVLSAASDGVVTLWDLEADTDDAPPYTFPHGGHWPEIAMRSGPGAGRVTVTVGKRTTTWGSDGTRLVEHPGPRRPSRASARSAFPRLGLYAEWQFGWENPADRCFRLRDDTTDAVVDEIHLDAAPVSSTAVDASTLAVLDDAGHLSFWHLT